MMFDHILISVIIPCYNCEKSLQRCVDSFVSQDVADQIEIILVDDGSTDDTSVMCNQYADSYDYIKTIHQKNGGLVCAWKAGVVAARGEYISFCDSDDYVENGYFEKIEELINQFNADIIAYGITIEYDADRTIKVCNKAKSGFYSGMKLDELKDHLLFNGQMQSELFVNSRCAKVFRTELLRNQLDEINDDLTYGEDAVTTYAAVLASRTILCINEWSPYHYIRNDQSMIGKHDSTWYEKIKIMRQGLFEIDNHSVFCGESQINSFFFSWVLLFIKKEIGRDINAYSAIISHLREVRNDELWSDILPQICINRYSVSTKVFASLFIKKKIITMFCLTKIAIACGIGEN